VVSHQHRYGHHYQKVKEIIASGAIGRVHTSTARPSAGLMHMMSHMIDYASWYNDYSDPVWVAGQAFGTEKFADVHASPDYIAASSSTRTASAATSSAGPRLPTCPRSTRCGTNAGSAPRAAKASPRC